MSESNTTQAPEQTEYLGVYHQGVVRLSCSVEWPNGTTVAVRIPDNIQPGESDGIGKVIIAGFGLAGRWIADIFDRHNIDYVIVEQNPETIATQRKLGRDVIQGDIGEEETLRRAGIEKASILALTIPDEQAVMNATRIGRTIKPDLYIVARTNYSSAGLQAVQCGADEVVKAEQAIARQFYERLLRKINSQMHVKK